MGYHGNDIGISSCASDAALQCRKYDEWNRDTSSRHPNTCAVKSRCRTPLHHTDWTKQTDDYYNVPCCSHGGLHCAARGLPHTTWNQSAYNQDMAKIRFGLAVWTRPWLLARSHKVFSLAETMKYSHHKRTKVDSVCILFWAFLKVNFTQLLAKSSDVGDGSDALHSLPHLCGGHMEPVRSGGSLMCF